VTEPPRWERYRAQVDALAAAPLNFDPERLADYTPASGWHVDKYQVELVSEPPGSPLPNGSWAVAQRIVRDYRFPEPRLVTGIYDPSVPLEQRTICLQARFLVFTFLFGVRVGRVIDAVRITAQGPERIWGFSYLTLRGHFERGQNTFLVVKELDSGRVHFRIRTISQPAEIANPVFRLGFKIFGRAIQRRFAKRALARMQALVRREVRSSPAYYRHPAGRAGRPLQPRGDEMWGVGRPSLVSVRAGDYNNRVRRKGLPVAECAPVTRVAAGAASAYKIGSPFVRRGASRPFWGLLSCPAFDSPRSRPLGPSAARR
jgi:hypothetical protein